MVETLKGFVSIYDGLSSFPEIFLPISTLLLEILENPNIPDLLKDNLRDVIDLIREKVDELHMLRRPLQMRKQKPVPIKLLNPKFEEKYVLILKTIVRYRELRAKSERSLCPLQGSLKQLESNFSMNWMILQAKGIFANSCPSEGYKAVLDYSAGGIYLACEPLYNCSLRNFLR